MRHERCQVLALGQAIPAAVATGGAEMGDARGCLPLTSTLQRWLGQSASPSLHSCSHAVVLRKYPEGTVRAGHGLLRWAWFCYILL